MLNTFLFALALGAMAGDVAVTDIAIKNGKVEKNPLIVKAFGKRPEAWQLALVKLPGLVLAGVALAHGAWPVPVVLAGIHGFIIYLNWKHLA